MAISKYYTTMVYRDPEEKFSDSDYLSLSDSDYHKVFLKKEKKPQPTLRYFFHPETNSFVIYSPGYHGIRITNSNTEYQLLLNPCQGGVSKR